VRIVFSPEAKEDLRQAYEYIARDSLEAADRLLQRVTEVVGLLAAGDFEGREVRLLDGRRVRS
jgi:plasmid stabilization system protein ParE